MRGMPDYFLKVVEFSRSAADFHFAVLSDHRYPRRIVAAIFQPPQTIKDEWHDFSWDRCNRRFHTQFSLQTFTLGAGKESLH